MIPALDPICKGCGDSAYVSAFGFCSKRNCQLREEGYSLAIVEFKIRLDHPEPPPRPDDYAAKYGGRKK